MIWLMNWPSEVRFVEPIFALDIGTRTVMGFLACKNEQGYEISACARTEHQQRAMFDGQVHNVDEVARAVERVKIELEKKGNVSLRKVAVAAAGRTLKTCLSTYERSERFPILWEKEDVLALEMEAVERALHQIESSDSGSLVKNHCVGYDVVETLLDGQKIDNLIGQRGLSAQVSIIATFLPRMVIDGLVSVLTRVGLEMESLTLEPIAAGQAAIPHDMRRLNLALVDIGAGTADIALTKNGSFFAYGMVPIAGDEITEAICTQYLLDFNIGEKVKRELSVKEQITFTDFLGTKINVPREEIIKIIDPAVRNLATKISTEILNLNRALPQAIILIGGGSLTPGLPDLVAEIIGISKNRVGIQIRERIASVHGLKAVKGPDVVTPIGIAMTALEGKGLHYYTVRVNGTPIPIFELQLATAAEALLAAGIQPRSFLGRPGAALTYEWNGEMRLIKGKLGKPAQLLINGKEAGLEQKLQPGDEISFSPGVSGEDAKAILRDIIPLLTKNIVWNNEPEIYSPLVVIDGKIAAPDTFIKDGDKISYHENSDLENLLKMKGYSWQVNSISIKVNGHKKEIFPKREIKVNGNLVTQNCLIDEGDRIELVEKPVTLQELGLKPEPLIFYINGEEISYPPKICRVMFRGQELSQEQIISENMELRVEGFDRMPILSDILPYVSVSQPDLQGEKLILKVNRKDAEFTTILYPGDRIEIGWA